MKILAIDPGIYNFAYCVVDNKFKITAIGHLDNPIQSIKKDDLMDNLNLFKWDIENLIKKSKLQKKDFVVVERYQSRHRGIQTELVNIMIGIIAEKLKNSNLILVMPAIWKTYMKRHCSMKKKGMKKLLNLENISEHMADAIGIAIYAFGRYFGTKIMEPLLLNKEEIKFIGENYVK